MIGDAIATNGGVSAAEATGYALTVRLNAGFTHALARTREALRQQGFGVLTEIDVTAVMQEKLGVEMARYVILGACNPVLAHRALSAEPELGLLLPCNVVVREDGDGTLVQAVDPAVIARIAPRDEVQAVAAEARQRLQAALDSIPLLTPVAEREDVERHRSVTVPVVYGSLDIERAADSLHLSLSDQETDAILARIDGDLDELGNVATRSALASRIYDDLAQIAHLHTSSDDD
jgi:uncharacterized protein (DUF302 family)